MKKIILPITAIALSFNALSDEVQYITTATATLKDGSTLKSDFLSDSITGASIFLEKVQIKPSLIKSLSFCGTNNDAKVELVNADRFAIKVADISYRLKTALGELDIQCDSLRSLSFSKRRICQEPDAGALLFHCTFDNLESVKNPTVGPDACYSAATITNEGKVGSLHAQQHVPQAAYDLPPNFLGKAGCIEFSAKILKRTNSVGWGGDPRFFTINDKTTGNTFFTLDIVSNNGAGNSGFATWTLLGNMASIRGMHNLTYSELFPSGNYQDWHHYAIVWDDAGIPGRPDVNSRTALFVDGKLIPCAKFDIRDNASVERLLSAPTRLSFTNDPEIDVEHQTKSPFLIDEFKIWNFAKTEFDPAE